MKTRLSHATSSLSVLVIYAMIHANMQGAIRALWTATWHAIIVWCSLATPLVAAVYAMATPMWRLILRGQTARAAEAV